MIIGIWAFAIMVIVGMSQITQSMTAQGMMSYQAALQLNQHTSSLVISLAVAVNIGLYLWLKKIIVKVIAHIEEIITQAENMGKHQPTHHIRQCEIQEIARLMAAIDKMAERYYRTIRKLAYQKSKVELVLAYIKDGILILDEEGYIVDQNAYAKKYLAITTLTQETHISAILRDASCDTMIQQALHTGETASCEILKNNQILHVRMGKIGQNKDQYGYIVTMTDITKTRQLEAIRYEFVTNVTHELKTPLTSIQGFVETLQNGAIQQPEVAERFLAIIDVEAKRLYRLIQDILLLSEIENMEGICTETVDVGALIEEVSALLVPQAAEKGILLHTEYTAHVTLEKVSRDHIKQIVVNLVSNAIKYTDEGCVTIHLGVEQERHFLEVRDTGIGIERAHIDRVFERFYRVDKSRSRTSGGTGLGLSIVKHIVQLYHWDLDVVSEPKKGSTFKIRF